MDDEVSTVGGFQGEAAIADGATVSSLLMHFHDVLQVVSTFSERHLHTQGAVKKQPVSAIQ